MATLFTIIVAAAASVIPVVSIVMKGQVTLNPMNEELNIFIVPVGYKRLLGFENCNNSNCQLSIIDGLQNDTTNLTTVGFRVDFINVKPEYTGLITACVTSKGFREKVPFQNVNTSNCDTSSITLVFPPSPENIENNLELAFYTWFMDHRNYQSLTTSNFTEVLIPQYATGDYSIRLFGIVLFSGKVRCQMYYSNSIKLRIIEDIELDSNVKQFFADFNVRDSLNGHYSFNCTTTFEREGTNITVSGRKILVLKVVKVPSVSLLESFNYGLIDGKFTGNLSFIVASLSSIDKSNSITITKINDAKSNNIELKLKYQAVLFEYYDMIFPLVNADTIGQYNITARVSTQQEVSEVFSVKLSTQLTEVTVTPLDIRIVNGTNTSFECTVTSQEPIQIAWTKDDTSFNTSSTAVIERVQSSKNTQVLHLSILSAQYDDTGIYICSAQTYLQNISRRVELLVLPPGSPYLNPNYNDESNSVTSQTTVLIPTVPTSNNSSITIHTILNFLKEHSLIAGSAGGAAGAVILFVFIITIIVCCRKWKRKRAAVDDESDIESPPLRKTSIKKRGESRQKGKVKTKADSTQGKRKSKKRDETTSHGKRDSRGDSRGDSRRGDSKGNSKGDSRGDRRGNSKGDSRRGDSRRGNSKGDSRRDDSRRGDSRGDNRRDDSRLRKGKGRLTESEGKTRERRKLIDPLSASSNDEELHRIQQ